MYTGFLALKITKSVLIAHIIFNHTGRFIKNQQKYSKLIQLFTRAWRNKNSERKRKKYVKM